MLVAHHGKIFAFINFKNWHFYSSFPDIDNKKRSTDFGEPLQ